MIFRFCARRAQKRKDKDNKVPLARRHQIYRSSAALSL